MVTELAGPESFSVKLLENHTLPVDMKANETFNRDVAELRKAVSALSDIVGDMDNRLSALSNAALDVQSPIQKVLERHQTIRNDLNKAKLELFGDATRARREFEVTPSINDRVSTIQGNTFGVTVKVSASMKESLLIAQRQFSKVLPEVKRIEQNLQQLEQDLEMAGAPYTPGRWPEWEGK
jgi:chromosome segregation ATPase